MHFIDHTDVVFCIKMRLDLSSCLLYFEAECRAGTLHDGIHRYILKFQVGLLTIEHRHLQNLLNLETQSFGFVGYHSSDMLHHVGRLRDRRVIEHLRSKRNTRDRSLELMRHIVDEVVLDLAQLLLSEHHIDDKNEKHQHYQGEHKRRDHEM